MAKQAAKRYPYPYAQVFDYVARAIPMGGSKYQVIAADPANGTIDVSSSIGLMTWGNNTRVLVRSESAEWTRVELVTSMKFGLVDWGQRTKEIGEMLRAIDSVLPGGQDLLGVPPAAANPVGPAPTPVAEAAPAVDPAVQAAVAAGWHPDPAGRHELRYWDGALWTEHVSDAGVTAVDPLS